MCYLIGSMQSSGGNRERHSGLLPYGMWLAAAIGALRGSSPDPPPLTQENMDLPPPSGVVELAPSFLKERFSS